MPVSLLAAMRGWFARLTGLYLARASSVQKLERRAAAQAAQLAQAREETARLAAAKEEAARLAAAKEEAARLAAEQAARLAVAGEEAKLWRAKMSDDLAALTREVVSSAAAIRALQERQAAGTAQVGAAMGQLHAIVQRTIARLELVAVRGPGLDDAAECLALARLFGPCRAMEVGKVRVGASADGGYVMLDDLGAISHAISLGIGEEVSWDLDLAERGIEVLQFDHTVSAPPQAHRHFRFEQTRIAAAGTDGALDLVGVFGRLPADEGRGIVLKIDVEHDEWAILDDAPEDLLARCDQILVEFHWFGRALDEAWRARAMRVARKLNAGFGLVHVHANNWGAYALIGGVPFPAVLEATYASRRRFRFSETDEVFPTPLDRANDPGQPDYVLGRFQF